MEKLLAGGSIPELAMRRCVLGKDTLLLFRIAVQQSTRCGGPARRNRSRISFHNETHKQKYDCSIVMTSRLGKIIIVIDKIVINFPILL